MTGKVIDSSATGILVLILPLALTIIFILKAWPYILLLIGLSIVWRLWQEYQWQQWCSQINPFFNQLIKENQGCLTPMDLSLKANLTARGAKVFLEKKAEEYGAQRQNFQDKGTVYYFLTASALGSIFEDSEPPLELESNTNTVAPKQQPKKDNASSAEQKSSVRDIAKLVDMEAETTAPEQPETPPTISTKTQVEEEKTPQTATEITPAPPPKPPMFKEESVGDSGDQEKLSVTTDDSGDQAKLSVITDDSGDQEKLSVTTDDSESEEDLEVEEETSTPETSDRSLSVLDTLSESGSKGLNQADLAKRLEVHSSTVGKRKSDPDFAEWSQSKDPEGVSWKYSRKTRVFIPIA